MSQHVDLQKRSNVKINDVAAAIIETICGSCPLKGTVCKPNHRQDMAFGNIVAIDNLHDNPDNGSGPANHIPDGCKITGRTFIFSGTPTDLKLSGYWPTYHDAADK